MVVTGFCWSEERERFCWSEERERFCLSEERERFCAPGRIIRTALNFQTVVVVDLLISLFYVKKLKL